MIEKFRPLTPPCVPFGTRRFNQFNMLYTFQCNNLTLRLVQIRLIFYYLSLGICHLLYILLHILLHIQFFLMPILELLILLSSLFYFVAFSNVSICTYAICILYVRPCFGIFLSCFQF